MAIHPQVASYSVAARPDIAPTHQKVGVLLSHGFTGSTYSMQPWAEALAVKGYAVEAPLLPGHGTTWQEMNTTTWHDWYGAVQAAFQKLRAENDKVVLAGLSMGGALVLRLAADHPQDVSGVMLVNPAVKMGDPRLAAVPLLKRVVPSMPGVAGNIKKPGVDEYGYDRVPLHALHSFLQGQRALRADLPKVTAPLLIFKSSVDKVVGPASVRVIKERVSSRLVTERVLTDSYHVATLDNDAPTIVEESLQFIHTVTHPLRPD